MAKAKTIDDVVKTIIDNYSTLLEDAVKHVAKQTEKEIKDKAVAVLHEYYYGGYKPTSYERSYALEHAIVPFSYTSRTGSAKNLKLQCNVGVEYSPLALENYIGEANNYSYDASKKYGEVDADWVIENFWAGRHPYTDGSTDSEKAMASFGYKQSAITQERGMDMTNEDTGRGLSYIANISFPKAVMEYILDKSTKLF